LQAHGNFNNSLSNALSSKNNLDSLPSLSDLNIFNFNCTFDNDINPDLNLHNIVQHDCRYFSPHSFDLYKNTIQIPVILNYQNHLLSELKFTFDIIGVSETRIVGDMPLTPIYQGIILNTFLLHYQQVEWACI
jgi:hypothetical protein